MDRADELASFTEEPGRITRPYGTRSLKRARETVQHWMDAAGLTTHIDAVGNLIGRTRSASDAPTFVLGSHIDSVRNAGRYDGVLGVLVALAALDKWSQDQRSRTIAVEVVAFIDEEGLRFRSSYLGSRVYCGAFDPAELEFVDGDGISLAKAAEYMGGDPSRMAEPPPSWNLLGYCEVHIEQGPVLETRQLPVGIVSTIAGQSRGSATFAGVAGHAGTVPMVLRRDALCGAAEFVLAVERLGRKVPGLVATAGQISVYPGAGNVIPGEARVTYDVRHQDDAIRNDACDRLERNARATAKGRSLGVTWQSLQEHTAVPCSPRLRSLIADAMRGVGIEPFELPSGAGHDAVSMAAQTDIAMLFVRCRHGISHHPDESVDERDVAIAVATLERFVDLAGGLKG